MTELFQMVKHDVRRLLKYELDLQSALQELGSPYALTSLVWVILRLAHSSLYLLIPAAIAWKWCWYAVAKPLCLFWGQRLLALLETRRRTSVSGH